MSRLSSTSTPFPGTPRSLRAQHRHATFIDPQTAAKSKRAFSLSPDDPRPIISTDGSIPADTPLLEERQRDYIDPAWTTRGSTLWSKTRRKAEKVTSFVTSDTGKGIFKCALAYSLASMCTYIPALSALFGKQDSKHLIATISVYFHPARSLGSMLDASILACVAFIYTAVVSLVSMSVSVLFTDILETVALGHFIVVTLFVGGGLGFVGWVKVKRGDPLVNIACSLTSLSLITILTKEGAVQAGNYSFKKILYILEMIIAGAIATCAVSFLVFPVSGIRKLKENMTDVTDALSDMLGLITRSFISGDEQELEDHEFVAVNERFKKSSSKLGQSLKEAKYEHYLFGQERLVALEAKIAHCIQSIGQSIGGLRSAAAMQFVIVKQPQSFAELLGDQQLTSWNSISTANSPSLSRTSDDNFQALMRSIQSSSEGLRANSVDIKDIVRKQSMPWRSPQQIFELFIDHLGPPMRALAYTMKEILDDLPFDPEANYTVANNPRFRTSLDRALTLYKQTRKDALKLLYDQKDLDRTRPVEVEADWEEAAACCGHFSECLLEVAEQIKEFLECLDELQIEADEQPSGKSWNWMLFWKHYRRPSPEDDLFPSNQRSENETLRINSPEARATQDERYWRRSGKPMWKQILFRKLYAWLSVLRQEDNKFGLKVGIGAMLYALPAFIPATRPIYSHFRGEWGLLSYMLVCSMTIGASNTTGYQRLLGTCIGAVLALLAWTIADGSPVALTIFGFIMAYWTAWIIVGRGKGPMGRFIMLTYNLSALYAYSLTMADDPDDADEEDGSRNPLIYTIAGHRVVAVLTGVIWGMIVTRVIWPISARQKLKDGLSLLWLRMGLIWKRDPLSVFIDEHDSDNPNDRYMNLHEENSLQRFLAKLQSLVESSKHEFELRRPFPHQTYDNILKSTGRILEAFHAMNLVIQKDLKATPGEIALLKATATERSQLCTRISSQFGVLASSMKLEYSLATDTLPDSERARDRLLAKIFAYRKQDIETHEEGEAPTSADEDYSLLYTYALVTGQLSIEIQTVLKEVEELFGILDEESLQLQ